jgi:uncharacterized membrane protein YbhN (UPF0104 family)
MSAVTATAPAPEHRHPRWKRLVVWALVLVVTGALANLLGWNIRGWLDEVWDTIRSISVQYLIAGIFAGTVQTVATGFAWFSILVYAFPPKAVRFLPVVACYAASVALNNILPANLGTLALLLMYASIIAGATFAGVLGSYAVEKIFFCVIGAFPYLYLFFSVDGSFDLKFGFVSDHPWATATLLIGGAFLIALGVMRLWPRIVRWWAQAKDGAQILVHPRAYVLRVVLPSFVSWVAMLGVIAAFMAAYAIPVSFDTLMRVVAGNSIANVTSVTPGGAGVTQAFNVASLNGVTDPATATAYSVAQQLVMTCWTIVVAIVLMVWAFGWTGGKSLVERSYVEAKEKAAEQKAAHDARHRADQDPGVAMP